MFASELKISIEDGSAIQRLWRSEVINQGNGICVATLARISHQQVEFFELPLRDFDWVLSKREHW